MNEIFTGRFRGRYCDNFDNNEDFSANNELICFSDNSHSQLDTIVTANNSSFHPIYCYVRLPLLHEICDCLLSRKPEH